MAINIKAQRKLTAKRLRELIEYNPVTGDFIWLVNCSGQSRGVGGIAGSIWQDGYRSICIDKIDFRAHRLAFLWMTGEWPANEVDHINRNRSDNRWVNLRGATRSQNTANSQSFRRPSNLKGVKRHSCGKFEAGITVNRKIIYLGLFSTPEEAHAVYVAAAKKYFGEYANVD